MGRPPKLTPLEKMTIAIEFNLGKGTSTKVLGEKYGVSARTIRRIIEESKKI